MRDIFRDNLIFERKKKKGNDQLQLFFFCKKASKNIRRFRNFIIEIGINGECIKLCRNDV